MEGEPCRKCKVDPIDVTLRQRVGDFEKTLYHIAHIEQFLADEHREWLRLLQETEWFL
jgi:hypothetical protein